MDIWNQMDNNPPISFDKRTWYLNLNTKQWIQGPDLPYGRADHTCSLVTKPSRKIVIAGGTRVVDLHKLVYEGKQCQIGTSVFQQNINCKEHDIWYNQRLRGVDILDLDTNRITPGE